MNGARLSGVMPPTGMNSVCFGNTERSARSTSGPASSAGNSFSPSAPAASAAKPSVGVTIPGVQTMPSALAARITAASACGMTMTPAPASRTACAASTEVTVPAPIRQVSPKRSASSRMLTSGSGEFNGTSMMRRPASTRAVATGIASSGVRPRRIATKGDCDR